MMLLTDADNVDVAGEAVGHSRLSATELCSIKGPEDCYSILLRKESLQKAHNYVDVF
jgi:hypothetical protein